MFGLSVNKNTPVRGKNAAKGAIFHERTPVYKTEHKENIPPDKKSRVYEFNYDEADSAEKRINKRKYGRKKRTPANSKMNKFRKVKAPRQMRNTSYSPVERDAGDESYLKYDSINPLHADINNAVKEIVVANQDITENNHHATKGDESYLKDDPIYSLHADTINNADKVTVDNQDFTIIGSPLCSGTPKSVKIDAITSCIKRSSKRLAAKISLQESNLHGSPRGMENKNLTSTIENEKIKDDWDTYFGFDEDETSALTRTAAPAITKPAMKHSIATKKPKLQPPPPAAPKLTIQEIQAMLQTDSPTESTMNSTEFDSTLYTDDDTFSTLDDFTSSMEPSSEMTTTTIRTTKKKVEFSDVPLYHYPKESRRSYHHKPKIQKKYMEITNELYSDAERECASKPVASKKKQKTTKKQDIKFKQLAESLNSKFKEIENFQLAVE